MGRFITKDPYTWGPDDPRIIGSDGGFSGYSTKCMILLTGTETPQLQHLYVYCLSNPVNYIDPYGNVVWWIPPIVSGVIKGIGIGGGVQAGMGWANKSYIANINMQIIDAYLQALGKVIDKYGSVCEAPQRVQDSLNELRSDALKALSQLGGEAGITMWEEIPSLAK